MQLPISHNSNFGGRISRYCFLHSTIVIVLTPRIGKIAQKYHLMGYNFVADMVYLIRFAIVASQITEITRNCEKFRT